MRSLLAGFAALLLTAVAPGGAFANQSHQRGQSVTMSDLPAPVKATFDRESEGGRVEELRKQTKSDGKVVYTGEVVKNGQGTDLKVDSAGTVMHKGKAHDESKEGAEHGTNGNQGTNEQGTNKNEGTDQMNR